MKVNVVATGGTIASTGSEEGARATETIDRLLGPVLNHAPEAEYEAHQFCNELSFEFTFDLLFDLAQHVNGSASPTVITHGTDTMEETAYFLDLVLGDRHTVILTGAQRSADTPGADGPGNLLLALNAAVHPVFRETSGVFVAENDRIIPARRAIKTHTGQIGSFRGEPVAVQLKDGFRFKQRPRSFSDSLPLVEPTSRIPILYSTTGMDFYLENESFDGLVVAATGLGNVTRAIGNKLVELSVPVVVASRCPFGDVQPVYQSPGGSRRLKDGGVLFAGDLTPQKARIKLALALEQSAFNRLETRFDDPEHLPRSP